MTARTLQETEGEPAAWPGLGMPDPDYLGELDRHVSPIVVWNRIESWITRRWAARSVTYIAEGPGAWRARLHPFTLSTTERWQDGAWASCTLDATPLDGLELPGCGPYRVTGTAGDDGTIPPDVYEAANRLYVYFRGIGMSPWTATATYETEGSRAPAGWAAKAMNLSGAADLLRPYRRLGGE